MDGCGVGLGAGVIGAGCTVGGGTGCGDRGGVSRGGSGLGADWTGAGADCRDGVVVEADRCARILSISASGARRFDNVVAGIGGAG